MSVRVDSSLLQPCDQKRSSSRMDDSELDELVRIQIRATTIEQLQYAIPKTHVDPSTRNGSPRHGMPAVDLVRNRPDSAFKRQIDPQTPLRTAARRRPR